MGAKSIIEILRSVTREERLGPRPTFTEAHAVRAVLLVGATGHIGRGMLAQRLGLGEGASRTLLRRLVRQDVLKVGRQGANLTPKGRKIWMSLTNTITLPAEIDAGRLSLDKFNAVVLVRAAETGVKLGIEQRDAAIKEGAAGASTLIFRRGKFVMPGGSHDCESAYPDKVWSRLRRMLPLKERDVMIVTSAPSQQSAEMGCIASALATLSAAQTA